MERERPHPDAILLDLAHRHPVAGPILRAVWARRAERFRERARGLQNDIEQRAAFAPLPLAEIGRPLLVIHGTLDAVVPFSEARRVARAVPGAVLVALDGWELAPFTHLAAIRTAISDFQSGQMPAGSERNVELRLALEPRPRRLFPPRRVSGDFRVLTWRRGIDYPGML